MGTRAGNYHCQQYICCMRYRYRNRVSLVERYWYLIMYDSISTSLTPPPPSPPLTCALSLPTRMQPDREKMVSPTPTPFHLSPSFPNPLSSIPPQTLFPSRRHPICRIDCPSDQCSSLTIPTQKMSVKSGMSVLRCVCVLWRWEQAWRDTVGPTSWGVSE